MNIVTSKDHVYIDEKTHHIYDALRKKGAEDPDKYPFQTMKDVFMLAVYLGKKNNAFLPVASKSKDLFQGDVFHPRNDIPVLAAIAFSKDKDLEKLTDAKYLLEVAQGYANGGIHYVNDELVEASGKSRLFNFINLVD